MADPAGLNHQVELTILNILQQALPSVTNADTPPVTKPVVYRSFFSREQPTAYPMVEAQFRAGMQRPTAAGGAYSVPPGGTLVATGAPAGLPQQVPQLTIIRGGRIDDCEIDLKLRTEGASERSLISANIRSVLFSGMNSSGVPWLGVLGYYGVRLMGAHPDMFDLEDEGDSTEINVQLFSNLITLECSVTYTQQVQPTMGDGAILVATMAIPAGASPPWTV